MSTEIPIWVNGKIRWLSGIDKKTTCKDVIEVLLHGEGMDKSEAKDYTIMERWKKMERQLDENSKILKIWTHWGNEKKEVRLCLRRTDNEVDSGRGSPVTSGYVPSLRRKRNRNQRNGKPPWAYKETLHPRRLAELGRCDNYPQVETKQIEDFNDYESINIYGKYENKVYDGANIYSNKVRESENPRSRKTSGHKSYHCSNTGKLHSTPFSENYFKRAKCCNKRESKQRIRNSENIEKLMKLILVQGATIQCQLQKLKEREEQIDSLEQERHRERVEKNGRNYLLETYLGSLKSAEIPEDLIDAENENKKNTNSETETHANSNEDVKGSEINEKAQSWLRDQKGLLIKAQNKSVRSKSESRAQECKSEGNLKRTLSDNAIACTNINQDYGRVTSENTKEEYENEIELRRIQSQIEMWEKVFKINKKLEKEEETLVRLHIKIKKVQNENYRVAKGNIRNTEEPSKDDLSLSKNEEAHSRINDLEKMQEEQNCEKLKKNLEALKWDLEDNSKEIYRNFTRLMEEDEIVAQKRCCLSEIIIDLERTDQENDMLNEMLARRENKNFVDVTSFSEGGEDKSTSECFGNGFAAKNDVHFKKLESKVIASPESNDFCLNSLALPHAQSNISQRTEAEVYNQESEIPVKKEIVEISFDDQIQNAERSKFSEEKFSEASNPVPAGALKSILKNRKNGFSKMCNIKKEFQKCKDLTQNLEFMSDTIVQKENSKTNNPYVQSCTPASTPNRTHCDYTSYSLAVPYPLYVNFSNDRNQIYNAHLSNLSSNLKNSCHLKNPHPREINPTHFSPSAIVTTKALIHNDTDSSTSSDTSGLSSMYSSSITNEEPYVEKNYVLNTLV